MRHQMQDPRIALQIVPQIPLVIDDALQIVDTGIVVATAKIHRGNLIVQDQDAVPVDEKLVFNQLLSDLGYHLQPLLEIAHHKDLVDLGRSDIKKALNAEIVVLPYPVTL